MSEELNREQFIRLGEIVLADTLITPEEQRWLLRLRGDSTSKTALYAWQELKAHAIETYKQSERGKKNSGDPELREQIIDEWTKFKAAGVPERARTKKIAESLSASVSTIDKQIRKLALRTKKAKKAKRQ